MRKAVLVIDIQSVLFDNEPFPYERDAVIANINRVTAWARAKGYPVFMIQHERDASPIAYGSDGWQLQGSLHCDDSDLLIRKETSDSFLNTDLNVKLMEHEVSALIVCGYATEYCVDTTVRRAAALGFPVTLVADAHTTHDKDHFSADQIRFHHNKTLSELTSFDAPITSRSTEDVIR